MTTLPEPASRAAGSRLPTAARCREYAIGQIRLPVPGIDLRFHPEREVEECGDGEHELLTSVRHSAAT